MKSKNRSKKKSKLKKRGFKLNVIYDSNCGVCKKHKKTLADFKIEYKDKDGNLKNYNFIVCILCLRQRCLQLPKKHGLLRAYQVALQVLLKIDSNDEPGLNIVLDNMKKELKNKSLTDKK